MKKIFIPLLFLFLTIFVSAQKYQPTWESIDSRPVPAWFEDV